MRYVALALAVTMAFVAVSSVNADPRFHGGRVFVANEGCNGRAYRPNSIVLACGDGGLFATGISYRVYGGRSAVATAELHAHSCIPNCAESRFHAFPGSITLVDVVRCGGTLYYARARYRFTGGAPYGEPPSGTANIEPLSARCSTVLG
jgi:hypothetical protein